MSRALWLPDLLRDFGLEPVLVDGWKTRGSDAFDPRGSVDHHTAGAATGYMPSLGVLINGRPRDGIPGPLCNVGDPRAQAGDMRVYVIASGRCNHAGKGGFRGLVGNSSVLGLERENVGTTAEPWSEHRIDKAARVHAAFARGAGFDPSFCCMHKTWTPRKIDAHTTSGDDLRTRVAVLLRGEPPARHEPVHYPEDDMLRIPLTVDFFEGLGYCDLFAYPSERVVSVNVLGPDPEAVGSWDETNVPAVEKATRDGHARLVFEANRPVMAKGVSVEAWVTG